MDLDGGNIINSVLLTEQLFVAKTQKQINSFQDMHLLQDGGHLGVVVVLELHLSVDGGQHAY